MANLEGKGGFRKGQSGNPTGRPKEDPHIKAMFRAKAPEAFEVLSKHLGSEDPRVAIAAAMAILDRGYGKPALEINATVNRNDARELTDAELAGIATSGSEGVVDEAVGPEEPPRVH